MENRAVINNSSLEKSFRMWLELTKHFNKLTGQEMDVLAGILYQRYLISKEISNEAYIDKILFSIDTRKVIRDRLGIKPQVFLNIYSGLRRKKVLGEQSVKKSFIPVVENDTIKIVFELRVNEKGQGNK